MKNIVLRTNAVPVYGFLSVITAKQVQNESLQPRKILDCGAGGPVPPLVLFAQHGFEAWGIDSSEDQLAKARQFCQEQGVDLHLQQGDMRCIPFEDETFDYIYEHYAMCHLNKRDTAQAVQEMYRVLKPGGLCFLGVISMDSWPRSLFGQEQAPGEFWGEEDGDELALHSLFTDQEADDLVSAWEVNSRYKQIRYLREMAVETTFEAWMTLNREAGELCPQEEWKAKFETRANAFQYVHLYFILKKM